jgi:hypothetical protein
MKKKLLSVMVLFLIIGFFYLKFSQIVYPAFKSSKNEVNSTPLSNSLTKDSKQVRKDESALYSKTAPSPIYSENQRDCVKTLESDPSFVIARQKIWTKLPEFDSWFYKNPSGDVNDPKFVTNVSIFFRALSMACLLKDVGTPEDLDQAKTILTNLAKEEPENAALLLPLAIVYEKLGQPSEAIIDRIRNAKSFYSYYGMVYLQMFSNVDSPVELIAAASVADNLKEIDWAQFSNFAQRHNLQILVSLILNTLAEEIRDKNSASLHAQDYEFAMELNSKADRPLDLTAERFGSALLNQRGRINNFISANNLGCNFEAIKKLIPEIKANIQPPRPIMHKVGGRESECCDEFR